MSIQITNENFQKEVVEASAAQPVLVDFYAEWCGPCKMLAPVLEDLSEKLQGQAIIAKVNVEQQPALSQQFAVRSIPSLFIFRNGEVVENFVGMQPTQSIIELLKKHMD